MLYKYFSYNENSLAMLVNKELWASHPSKFNDPFDSVFFSDHENEDVRKYIQQKAICCFSEDHKNILMWSHYSDKHTGFCVGFDKEQLKRIGLSEGEELKGTGLLEKVTYQANFPSFSLENLKSSASDNVRLKELVKLFITKFTDWEYEEEWRLIFELDPKNYQNEKSGGKCVEIQDDCIKVVYFGCEMPLENQKTLRNILNDSRVSFKKMSKCKTSFALTET